jgi:hypothetical protein
LVQKSDKVLNSSQHQCQARLLQVDAADKISPTPTEHEHPSCQLFH